MANPGIKPVMGGEIATGAAKGSQPSPKKGRLVGRIVIAQDEKKETGTETSPAESKPAFQDFRRRGLLHRVNTGAVDEFETQQGRRTAAAPKYPIERSRLKREKEEQKQIEVRKIEVTRMKKSSDEGSQ